MKISVVINTRNEAEVLPRAIESVKDFAEEIVVIDMESIDDSVKLAKKLGAKVYSHKPVDYVEPARNFGISKATCEWILILDPDEETSTNLAKKLKEIVKNPTADYYRIPRKNMIFGKWMEHSRWWPDYNIRFFKKGKVSWNEIIHTVPVTLGDGADLDAKAELAIIHHHYDSIEQFVERLNRYTTIQAKRLYDEKKQFEWLQLIQKPTAEFLSRYFAGSGYKDGIHGLALAFLQSFSELIVYLKLWQLQGFEQKQLKLEEVIRQMREVEAEEHYWQADSKIREGAGISERVKRKFKLP